MFTKINEKEALKAIHKKNFPKDNVAEWILSSSRESNL